MLCIYQRNIGETGRSNKMEASQNTNKENWTSHMLCCTGEVKIDDKEHHDTLETSVPCNSSAPDGGWGWVVILSTFMISFILDGISFTFGLLFGELLNHFKSNQSETSAIISVLNGTYLGIGPVASLLVSAFGGRRIGALGGLLAAAGIFFSTLSPNVHVMIILYGFIAGAGFGLLYLPAIVSVGQYFEKRRALATGIAVCGSGVGSFVFAPLCELLIETYTWKGALWILSAISLNCIPFAILLRPVENQVASKKGLPMETLLDHDIEEKIISKSQATNDEIRKMFDYTLLKSPTFLLYGFSAFSATLGFFVPYTFIPGQILEFGMTLRQSALLLSIIGIFNTVTRLVVGWVSDRSWADASIINVIALIVGGVVTMCVPILSSFGLFAIFCVLFGYSIAVFTSLRSVIMAELLGVERLTSSFGLVTLCQGTAAFIGSPIAGALTDATGGYKAAFYFSGLCIALSGVICIPLRRISVWESNRQSNTNGEQNPVIQTVKTY